MLATHHSKATPQCGSPPYFPVPTLDYATLFCASAHIAATETSFSEKILSGAAQFGVVLPATPTVAKRPTRMPWP